MSTAALDLYNVLVEVGVEKDKARRVADEVISREDAKHFVTKLDIKDLKLDLYKFIFLALFGQALGIVALTVTLIQVLA